VRRLVRREGSVVVVGVKYGMFFGGKTVWNRMTDPKEEQSHH